jgi:hypothetical protein
MEFDLRADTGKFRIHAAQNIILDCSDLSGKGLVQPSISIFKDVMLGKKMRLKISRT